MGEPLASPASTDVSAAEDHAPLSVVARDVHVTYRVYADRRPRLREIVSSKFRRPSYREIHAVRGVDLEVHEGEAVGLIGRNGSGKSTLLRSLAGLLPPTSGEVYAKAQPALMGVGAALKAGVSGRRNVQLGGLALGLTRDEVEAQMADIIEFTGLEDYIDLPLRTYSSGMRARLHFAISTAVQPEILLIDEALATGDAEFQERSKQRIDELLDSAGTVFLVSHSLGTIRRTCPRSLWMDHGRILMDGPTQDVIKAYKDDTDRRRDARRRKQEGRE